MGTSDRTPRFEQRMIRLTDQERLFSKALIRTHRIPDCCDQCLSFRFSPIAWMSWMKDPQTLPRLKDR
jgi:hypothetical protein